MCMSDSMNELDKDVERFAFAFMDRIMLGPFHDTNLHNRLAGPQPFAAQCSYSGAVLKANAIFLVSPFYPVIGDLKDENFKEASRSFVGCDRCDVRISLSEKSMLITVMRRRGKELVLAWQPAPNNQVLDVMKIISDIWEQSPDGYLLSRFRW